VTAPIILLSNDDGIDSAGLAALEEAAAPLGEVWVVAPDSEKSAVSSAITLREPLRIRQHGTRRFSVTGTPADCVYVALNHILDDLPDLCLSGVNHGANLGDDVHYSGTVAAALEACLEDVPSMAVSLADYRAREFDVAASFATRLAGRVLDRGLPRGILLNINVPPGATQQTPARVTSLGRRNYGRLVTEKRDPFGRPYYWIGGAELTFDDLPGSDCNAIADESITVTPVDLDLTHYRFAREMRGWHDIFDDERHAKSSS
jgi:5'-nucleotidase